MGGGGGGCFRCGAALPVLGGSEHRGSEHPGSRCWGWQCWVSARPSVSSTPVVRGSTHVHGRPGTCLRSFRRARPVTSTARVTGCRRPGPYRCSSGSGGLPLGPVVACAAGAAVCSGTAGVPGRGSRLPGSTSIRPVQAGPPSDTGGRQPRTAAPPPDIAGRSPTGLASNAVDWIAAVPAAQPLDRSTASAPPTTTRREHPALIPAQAVALPPVPPPEPPPGTPPARPSPVRRPSAASRGTPP